MCTRQKSVVCPFKCWLCNSWLSVSQECSKQVQAPIEPCDTDVKRCLLDCWTNLYGLAWHRWNACVPSFTPQFLPVQISVLFLYVFICLLFSSFFATQQCSAIFVGASLAELQLCPGCFINSAVINWHTLNCPLLSFLAWHQVWSFQWCTIKVRWISREEVFSETMLQLARGRWDAQNLASLSYARPLWAHSSSSLVINYICSGLPGGTKLVCQLATKLCIREQIKNSYIMYS